jgi:hypothetical protein
MAPQNHHRSSRSILGVPRSFAADKISRENAEKAFTKPSLSFVDSGVHQRRSITAGHRRSM